MPDLTDKAFAGNQSGVAMRYKLFGLEQLCNEKERWFREGLRCRLRLLCAFLAVKGQPAIDADSIEITFTRNLPADTQAQAGIVTTLRDLVSDETLLRQLEFVDDPEAEMARVQEQRDAALARQKQAMADMPDNRDEPEDEPKE